MSKLDSSTQAGLAIHDVTDFLLHRQELAVGTEGADAIFLVQVQVEALDRKGLLHDISRVLSDNGVNLLQATMSTSKERVAKSHFVFEMADPRHLQTVLREMRKIEGVYDAYRVTGSKKAENRRVRR